GGHLLVTHLDELDLVLGPLERADDGVDAVTGIAVDPPHAVLVQPLEEEVGRGLLHDVPFSWARSQSCRLRTWACWSNGPCAACRPTGSKRLSARSGSTGSSV